MKRSSLLRKLAPAISLTICLANGIASAYTVQSGVTANCHEKITYEAYSNLTLDLGHPASLPKNNTWKSLYQTLLGFTSDDLTNATEIDRYVLVSLIIGARAPDTDGHSVMSLANLHFLHSDAAAAGQYAHSLRAPDDDYEEGNAIAILGTQLLIRDLIDDARHLLSKPDREQHIQAPIYLDFYGRVKVTVWGPAYNVGRAAHALQDTFSHTIRSDDDSLRRIVHVMNYIDAISQHFNAERDGFRHSDTFDNCKDSDVAPLVEAATNATTQLLEAAITQQTNTETDPLSTVLDEWMSLKTGCTMNNNYCENHHWLEIARKDQTRPYLMDMLGCSQLGSRPSTSSVTLLFLAELFGLTK